MATTTDKRARALNYALPAGMLVPAAVLDLATPLGVAVGILYVFIVLGCYWSRDARFVGAIAAVSVVLVAAGYVLSEGLAPVWHAAANRILTGAAIIAVAAATIRQLRLTTALDVTSARTRAIIESAPDAVISIDASSRVVGWNRQAERIFGWPREEAHGQPLDELITPPSQRGQRDASMNHYLMTGEGPVLNRRIEIDALRRDGSEFPVELTVMPVQLGDRHEFSAFVRDITERKEAEEQTRLAVEAAPNGMLMMAADGTIVMVNSKTEEIFGYAREEMIGQRVEMLMPERYRAAHPERRNNFQRNPGARAMGAGKELFGLRKDGTEFPLDIGLNPFTMRDKPFVLAAIVDQTTSRQAEQLRLYATELERSNQDLDEFAYVASHDLKAPLRGISSLAGWISEDAADHLPDGSKKHLEQLRGRVTRMERLLDDLLAYSRAGRVHGDVVEVNTYEMLRHVLELSPPGDGVEVTFPEDMPTLVTAQVPLETCFRNFISNAIKHHDNDNIHIDIAWTRDGDMFEFAVADDGPGIPEQYHERIFKMFQTLAPRDSVEGSGMGLAVIKRLVESYGGRVTLESTAGNGACFRFTWPATMPGRVALSGAA